MKIINFPSKKEGCKKKSKSDQLLEQFAEWCLIYDDAEQQIEFTKLREAIFEHLSKTR